MAKIAKLKTEAALQLETAKSKLPEVKAKAADNPNEKNTKALDHLQNEIARLSALVRREHFQEIAGTRVTKALNALKNVGSCARPRSYTYDVSDITKLEDALTSATLNAVDAFKTSLKPSSEKPVKQAKFVF
jgi:hypothetical protein